MTVIGRCLVSVVLLGAIISVPALAFVSNPPMVLSVAGAGAAATVMLTANPLNITSGSSSTLTWKYPVSGLTPAGAECVGANFSTGTGNPPTGSTTVTPTATITYTVNCDNNASGNGGGLPGSILPPCPGGCTWSLNWGDEFNSNGACCSLAGSGIDYTGTGWNICGGEGSQSCSLTSASYVLNDCTHAAWESGGYLHIIPLNGPGLYNGTPSNPSYGCEIKHNLKSGEPGAGYWETRTNMDANGGNSDSGWLCCFNMLSHSAVEVDINETMGSAVAQKATVFWDNYASSQVMWQPASYLSGWHVYGILWEPSRGFQFWVDGTMVHDFFNPFGCSASNLCNDNTNPAVRMTLGTNGNGTNSTGMLVDWVRQYTHP